MPTALARKPHAGKSYGAQTSRTAPCRGFSLVELCVALFMSGLMFMAAIGIYRVYLKANYNETVKSEVQEIDTALQAYFAANGAMPCPAAPNLPQSDPNYGVANPGCAGTIPTAANPQRAAPWPPNFNPAIVIGSVPIRTLKTVPGVHISDADMMEPYGHQLIYAVTGTMTQISTIPPYPDKTLGAIDVRDAISGLSLLLGSPYGAGSALYIVISPGKDGCGVYNTQGVLGQACAAGGYEEENAYNGKVDTIFNGGTSSYSTQ